MRRPQDLELRLVLGFHHLALLVISLHCNIIQATAWKKSLFTNCHQSHIKLSSGDSAGNHHLVRLLVPWRVYLLTTKNARAKKDREPDQRFIIGQMNRDGWVERQTKSAMYHIFAPTNNVRHLQCSVRK